MSLWQILLVLALAVFVVAAVTPPSSRYGPFRENMLAGAAALFVLATLLGPAAAITS
jgi:hypothetical protein